LLRSSPSSLPSLPIDVGKKDKFLENKISIRVKRAQKILGTKISENEMIDIFERLDFKILEKNEDAILVQVPSYRNDISHEIDLIEEIARIYGYNNITKVKPAYRSSNAPTSEEYLFEREIKSYLRSCSLQEIKTCDLISPKLSEIALLNLDKDSLVSVKHFKSIDQSILRATLLPSLLEVVKFNHDHKNFDILSYEISKVHFKNKDEYIERPTLSLIMSGKRNPHLWDKSNFDVNFYDLKGILENVLSAVLDKKYKLFCLDVVNKNNSNYFKVNISKIKQLESAFNKLPKIDIIIHLAADSRTNAPWKSILNKNIIVVIKTIENKIKYSL